MGTLTEEEREERALANRASWRAERELLRRELSKLRREHRIAFADGFRTGSGHAFARLYRAAPNDSIRCFISQLSMSATVRKPPFGLMPEQAADVRTAVNQLVEKMGWTDEWAD